MLAGYYCTGDIFAVYDFTLSEHSPARPEKDEPPIY
jgi:hypothetical protein